MRLEAWQRARQGAAHIVHSWFSDGGFRHSLYDRYLYFAPATSAAIRRKKSTIKAWRSSAIEQAVWVKRVFMQFNQSAG
jgi:hypothetical protein